MAPAFSSIWGEARGQWFARLLTLEPGVESSSFQYLPAADRSYDLFVVGFLHQKMEDAVDAAASNVAPDGIGEVRL